MDNISEITQIIKDYLNNINTDYSIMINGKWGTGKTYFLKNYLEPELDKEILYITLNGIKELDEIDKLIVVNLYPILDSKSAKIAGGLASAALKYFNLDGLKNIMDLKELPKNLSNKVLCFDDLERTKIEIDQLLGYINKFVEHLSVKTLLICNERKLNEAQTYKDIKEKLVGITIEYMPDYNVVIADIIEQYKEDANNYFEFLSKNKQLVFDVFKKSATDNIRILKQSIIYYSKLFDTILNGQITNIIEARVFKFLLTTFFEIRSGVMQEDEFYKYIKDSHSFWMAKSFNKETKDKITYVDTFLDKYYEGSESEICSLVTVFDYIKTGYLNTDEFLKELKDIFSEKNEKDDKKYYLTENYWILSDKEFSESCDERLEEIKIGKAFSQEFYLKLFYYFLFYSRKGYINRSSQELLDLFTQGISKAQHEWRHKDINIGFIFAEEPRDEEYLLFKERIFELNNNLERKENEEKAKLLLSEIGKNFEKFINQFGAIESHDFIRIPVFKYWSPSDISSDIIKLSNMQIREFHIAFRRRYSAGNTWQDYTCEINNLSKVADKISIYAEQNTGKLSSGLLTELSNLISRTQKELAKYKKETAQSVTTH